MAPFDENDLEGIGELAWNTYQDDEELYNKVFNKNRDVVEFVLGYQGTQISETVLEHKLDESTTTDEFYDVMNEGGYLSTWGGKSQWDVNAYEEDYSQSINRSEVLVMWDRHSPNKDADKDDMVQRTLTGSTNGP